MVLLAFPRDVVLLPFSCVAFCFVDIWSILEHSSSHHSWLLATSNSSWLIPLYIVTLDVLCPLVHDFPVKYSPYYLVHRSFYPYKQFYFLSSSKVVSSTTWFLCSRIISTTICCLIQSSSLSICTFLLFSLILTWSFFDKASTLVFVFSRIYHNMKS